MPLIRKERKKKWQNKSRAWNGEIRLEPFLHMRAVMEVTNRPIQHHQGLKINEYTKLRSAPKGKDHQPFIISIHKERKYGSSVPMKTKSIPHKRVSVDSKPRNDNLTAARQTDNSKNTLKSSEHFSSFTKKEMNPKNSSNLEENPSFISSSDHIYQEEKNVNIEKPLLSDSVSSYYTEDPLTSNQHCISSSIINKDPSSRSTEQLFPNIAVKCLSSTLDIIDLRRNISEWPENFIGTNSVDLHSVITNPSTILSVEGTSINLRESVKNRIEQNAENSYFYKISFKMEPDSSRIINNSVTEIPRHIMLPSVDPKILSKNSSVTSIQERNKESEFNIPLLYEFKEIQEVESVSHALDTSQLCIRRTKISSENSLDTAKTESKNFYNSQEDLSSHKENTDDHSISILKGILYDGLEGTSNEMGHGKEKESLDFRESACPTIPTGNHILSQNLKKNDSNIQIFIRSPKNYECYKPNLQVSDTEEISFTETNESELILKCKFTNVILENSVNCISKLLSSSEKLDNDSKHSSDAKRCLRTISYSENALDKVSATEELTENPKYFITEESISLDKDKNGSKYGSLDSIQTKKAFGELVSSSNLSKFTAYNYQGSDVLENVKEKQFDDVNTLESHETSHVSFGFTKDKLSSNSSTEIESVKNKTDLHLASERNHIIEDLDKKLICTEKYSDKNIDKISTIDTREKLEVLMKPKREYDEIEIQEKKAVTDEKPFIIQGLSVLRLEDAKIYSQSDQNYKSQDGIMLDTYSMTSEIHGESCKKQLNLQKTSSIKLDDSPKDEGYNISNCSLQSNINQVPYVQEQHININCCTFESVPKVTTAVVDPLNTSETDYNVIKKNLTNALEKMRMSNSNNNDSARFENKIRSNNCNVISQEKSFFDEKTEQIVNNFGVHKREGNRSIVALLKTKNKNLINHVKELHENHDFNDNQNKLCHLTAVTTGNLTKERKTGIEEKIIRCLKSIIPWRKKKLEHSIDTEE